MQGSQLHISIAIAMIIGLQASTFVTGTQIWPFMAYCMYSRSREPGPIHTEKSQIIGRSASGKEFEIDHAIVGLSFFGTLRRYVEPMARGDRSAANNLAERLNGRFEDRIESFRVKTQKYLITEEGIVIEEKVIVYYVENEESVEAAHAGYTCD